MAPCDLGLETSPFPPYQSARPAHPKYNITDPQEQRWEADPLALLLMGILKVLNRYDHSTMQTFSDMQRVVGEYTEDDYDRLRENAEQAGKKLWTRGFWNALSDVMSHQALLKVRDMGNFYHLIPDNPNAIEC